MAKHQFQTEVNQILNLIIHSLYKHKEIYLRELISNAADALDKFKYLNLTNEKFKDLEFNPRIDIRFDDFDKKYLSIEDSGIGMSESELVENLGTIARSGTKAFMEMLTGDEKKDSTFIGQFGVGFYSAFMVADKIEVVTKKMGEDKAFKWISEGKGEYEVVEDDKDDFGTEIRLFLNDEGKEYSNRWSIQEVVKKYSNHIQFPIYLHYEETKEEGEGDDKKEIKELKEEQINSASALWKKQKSEIKDEDYSEFYKTIAHDHEDPMFHIHTQAEGKLEYTTLFYIPKKAPVDLYYANFQAGVKLYIQRVFITDDEKELLPTYLRFIKGVIDSEDLPLNVSRETLQHNNVLEKIKTDSVKKIISEFKKLSKDEEKYAEFYKEYARPIKEGVYQDFANKDQLLELVRFKSLQSEKPISLEEYFNNRPVSQKSIYYITGDNVENLKNSPLLEAYKKQEIDVLLMDDEIDEIVVPTIGKFKDLEFKSVTRSDAADELKTDDSEEKEKEIEPLIEKIKKVLGDEVKDVRPSSRLSDSPSCIVADEKDPTVQMQHILKAMGQDGASNIKPILEINPKHDIVNKLSSAEDDELIEDISRLLFEQALLIEGINLKNPAVFAKRLNRIMTRAF